MHESGLWKEGTRNWFGHVFRTQREAKPKIDVKQPSDILCDLCPPCNLALLGASRCSLARERTHRRWSRGLTVNYSYVVESPPQKNHDLARNQFICFWSIFLRLFNFFHQKLMSIFEFPILDFPMNYELINWNYKENKQLKVVRDCTSSCAGIGWIYPPKSPLAAIWGDCLV